LRSSNSFWKLRGFVGAWVFTLWTLLLVPFTQFLSHGFPVVIVHWVIIMCFLLIFHCDFSWGDLRLLSLNNSFSGSIALAMV